jgi:hypothetical protein
MVSSGAGPAAWVGFELEGTDVVCAIVFAEAASSGKIQTDVIKTLWMWLSEEKSEPRRTAVPLAGAIYKFAFFGQAGMSSIICLGNRAGISCLPLYLRSAISTGEAIGFRRSPASAE